MVKLRDYQSRIISRIREFFTKGLLHFLVVGPTGCGKTIMFCYMALAASAKNKKTIIFTDRSELLLQAGGTLRKFDVNPFYYKAGIKKVNKQYSTYVAMAQSFRNRIKDKEFRDFLANDIDLVIIDEAHKQEFNYLFESGLLDNKRVLGFTATPRRSGKQRQLALDYEDIIEEVTVQELIDLGYLVPDEYYGIESASMEGVGFDAKKGDYNETEMFSKFNNSKIYAGVVSEYQKVAKGTQTLVFCVNIEHVITTTLEFQKNGIDARFLVSKLNPPKELKENPSEGDVERYNDRLRIYELYKENYALYSGDRGMMLNRFEQQMFPVMVNAGILTTGYDCPPIRTIITNVATMSLSKWLQMIGRGSRLYEDKHSYTILDFGDNAKRLGHYAEPRIWSLWHESSPSGEGVPPMKDCGHDTNGKPIPSNKIGCNRMIPASTKICPFCGYTTPKKEAEEVELVSLMYDRDQGSVIKIKKPSEMSASELVVHREKRGYQQAWLWRQLYFKGGVEMIKTTGIEAGWSLKTITKAIDFCEKIEYGNRN